jgi:glycine dehydrogenase subunit 1
MADQIATVPGYSVANRAPFFNEVVVRCPEPVEALRARLAERQILAGYALGRDYPELADALLLCCTEANARAEIDRLVEALREGR